MEVVPDPRMEDHEANRQGCCLDVCVELGKEDETFSARVGWGEGIREIAYSLIFFKNPGVFNSRSRRYVK